jgi:hypothetical protein
MAGDCRPIPAVAISPLAVVSGRIIDCQRHLADRRKSVPQKRAQALKLGVWDLAIMKNTMQVGQLGMARVVGPFSDRYGNRPVLVACQWLVSVAMVFLSDRCAAIAVDGVVDFGRVDFVVGLCWAQHMPAEFGPEACPTGRQIALCGGPRSSGQHISRRGND